ncbi:MAG: DUF58 domain-containing protein [Thiobacillus sp.]
MAGLAQQLTAALTSHPSRATAFLRQVLRPAPDAAPVTLTQRRLYVLPTRPGLIFAVMLGVMLLGSINYANSMGFVLTFLLGSLAVVSILHTWRNLAKLTVRAGHSTPVFAGQDARFEVCLDNAGPMPRYSIALKAGDAVGDTADLAPHASICLGFALPATERGLLQAPSFTLFTTFPLGLFRCWTHLDLDMRCLVYPQPAPEALPLPVARAEAGSGRSHGEGHEDFTGLRTWHAGESLRQVAWKAVAREQGMLAKQFAGEAQQDVWLDWNALAGLDAEARLSRLTRWVLDADTAGQRYGLRLPDRTLAPGAGEDHRRQCLEALALFGR